MTIVETGVAVLIQKWSKKDGAWTGDWSRFELPTVTRSYVFTGLDPGSRYRVIVRLAVDGRGDVDSIDMVVDTPIMVDAVATTSTPPSTTATTTATNVDGSWNNALTSSKTDIRLVQASLGLSALLCVVFLYMLWTYDVSKMQTGRIGQIILILLFVACIGWFQLSMVKYLVHPTTATD
jgi:hypothetical protein